jgi:hypothetical protein
MEKIGIIIKRIFITFIIIFSIFSPITCGFDKALKNNVNSLGSMGILDFYPKSHDFGDITEGEVNSTTFEIWRAGGCCALEYALFSNCDWIDVFPTSGTSHGEHDIITVYVDTTGLDPGFYSCNINITSPSGNGVFIVNFTIIIENWPDIYCEANLHWQDIEVGSELFGDIFIMNEGDAGSLLDWMITSYPDWGIWNFSALLGYDITPIDPAEKITVSIIVPDEKNSDFIGNITIVNKHNISDFCNIDISISTPRINYFNMLFFDIFNNIQCFLDLKYLFLSF